MNPEKFSNCKLLVVGDLMIDEYVWGDVDRISPEAPVQVVSVTREDYTLGGSGNVVNNLAALNAGTLVAGVMGNDPGGIRMAEKFRSLGVDAGGVVKDPRRPTTRKTRIIAGSQHVLRIDRETRHGIAGETREAIVKYIQRVIPDVDAVLISDYGKGLLTTDLLATIIRLAGQNSKPAIVDPKGLDFEKYWGAFLITPNKKEAGLAAGIEIVDESTLNQAAGVIFKKTNAENLLITCGKEGMVLFEGGAGPTIIRSKARQVFDVSGAGDTVVAVAGLAIAAGESLQDAATLANLAAGIVVGKIGTAAVTLQELTAAMKPLEDQLSQKVKTIDEIPELVRSLKNAGKKIVLTNGCFDFLHAGHIKLFSASKQWGDVLIVAIDDDASVRQLKGAGRPVISAPERLKTLSALDSIDYVVEFSSGQLLALIETIIPDVLTKGGNYATTDVFGGDKVAELGGRVELIPVGEALSSSKIIKKIRSTCD